MKRFRQLRTDKKTRDKFAETSLRADDIIYPMFSVNGSRVKEEIPLFYGVNRYSPDMLAIEAGSALSRGINKILLFGTVADKVKNPAASFSASSAGPVPFTVKMVKKLFPEITVITDVCLCGYTDHGHCGFVRKGKVDNDATLPLLAAMAVAHADAGSDIVAPSAMMDGQVQAIRQALDKNGHHKVKILAYSAKYASNFYGPFRNAAKSSPAFGDRKTYQMDYRNAKQAMDEIKADIDEGADMVMVKPAMAYLDIISRAVKEFPKVPIAGYQVSGEYMMLKLAAKKGLMDEKEAFREALTAIKRAGAKYIITYYAKEAAVFLNT